MSSLLACTECTDSLLEKHGFARLARQLRRTDRANPYRRDSAAYLMWREQVTLNLPLLYLGCLLLRAFAEKQGARRLLFATRDCVHFQRLYAALYPDTESVYFDCSRNMFDSAERRRHAAFDAYVDSAVRGDPKHALYVDVHGTGQHMIAYFRRRWQHVPACFLLSGGNDRSRELPRESRRLLREGRLRVVRFAVSGTPIEMLNYDTVGTLQDYDRHGPVRAEPEYDVKRVRPYHACVDEFLRHVAKDEADHDEATIDRVIAKLFHVIEKREDQPIVSRWIDHVRKHPRDD